MLNETFAYTNTDLLYGFAGELLHEFIADLEEAIILQTTTLDVYPINNLAGSPAMHRALSEANLEFLDAECRMNFRFEALARLRSHGYNPISGYGFAAADRRRSPDDDPVQHSPKFLYHDLLYGYHDDEILGYGASATSQFQGFNLHNYRDRKAYVAELLGNRSLPQITFGGIRAPERGIVTFPLRGQLDTKRIPWQQAPEETLAALASSIEGGLVVDEGAGFRLTEAGWVFYVNLMYYLMPTPGRRWLSRFIADQERQGRRCGNTYLPGQGVRNSASG